MKLPKTTDDEVYIVESFRQGGGRWRPYDWGLSKASAVKSMKQGKHAWPDEAWRVALFKRAAASETSEHD